MAPAAIVLSLPIISRAGAAATAAAPTVVAGLEARAATVVVGALAARLGLERRRGGGGPGGSVTASAVLLDRDPGADRADDQDRCNSYFGRTGGAESTQSRDGAAGSGRGAGGA
ncbi:MAG: hypothetical protein ACOYD4_13525, partial [Solirubrobacterales bacterium]